MTIQADCTLPTAPAAAGAVSPPAALTPPLVTLFAPSLERWDTSKASPYVGACLRNDSTDLFTQGGGYVILTGVQLPATGESRGAADMDVCTKRIKEKNGEISVSVSGQSIIWSRQCGTGHLTATWTSTLYSDPLPLTSFTRTNTAAGSDFSVG